MKMFAAITLGVCATAGASIAEADTTGCSLLTLHGTMAYSVNYQKAGVPKAASGFESYDGAGHMTYKEIVSDGYTTNTYTGTGTYTITAGCIASVTYDGAGIPF